MPQCNISVIIPCYNYGRYLPDAIGSILSSNGLAPDYEIIVVNDHSNDKDTLETLSQWEAKDDRVRVVSNTGRNGVSAARNFGINEARGEWIAFLDADDMWSPDGLQLRWKILENFPDAQWVGGDFVKLYPDGHLDEKGFFCNSNKANQILDKASTLGGARKLVKPVREFLQVSLCFTGAIIVKKSLLVKVGGFDEDLRQAEDSHLWLRLAKEADFYFVTDVVAIYRQHVASLTHIDQPPVQWYVIALELLLNNREFRPYRKELRIKLSQCYAQNAYYYRKQGKKKLACLSALSAIKNTPLNINCWRNFVGALVGR